MEGTRKGNRERAGGAVAVGRGRAGGQWRWPRAGARPELLVQVVLTPTYPMSGRMVATRGGDDSGGGGSGGDGSGGGGSGGGHFATLPNQQRPTHALAKPL